MRHTSCIGKIRDVDTINGWSSYSIFYDKSSVESLKVDTAFIKAREMRGLPVRYSFSAKEIYKNFIEVPSVNVLAWSSAAFVSLLTLVGLLVYWVVR